MNPPNSSNPTSKILCIVGPTAGGKSRLAMEVARRYDGEIICADSQTIRRGLDIGTAKPSTKDQQLIAHHMLDIIGPYERFSAADFKTRAGDIIEQIRNKGKLPILVGGTGLYIDALLYDFSFRKTADPAIRSELEELSVTELQQRITDKGLALPTNAQNPRHLIRTLESKGVSVLNKKMRQDAVVIGVDPKEKLDANIARRVEDMLRSGFVHEVFEVLRKFGQAPQSWDAIGYKLVLAAGKQEADVDVDYIRRALATAHRQYAKRQRSWFKRNKHITWFEQPEDALEYLENIFVQ